MTASLFRDLPLRLSRVQVLNWGTFSNWHDIPVPGSGFLFVGHSGSGKSTLLDLFSVLLAPPGRRDFNAAARAGERGSKNDRSLVTYVRGAWSNTDNAMGEASRQYLRTGSTLSAAALTFGNGDRRQVTILGIFWINGVGQSDSDVNRLYAAMERPFDLSGLSGVKPDMRVLKNRLSEEVKPTEKYTAYLARALSLLGITSENALKLLRKAQSAKNLGDLTEFLRQHMLDTPRSFEQKDKLVNGFTELKECHRTVQKTRKQIETLHPAREAWTKRLACLLRRQADDEALEAVPRFIAERERHIHQTRLELYRTKRHQLTQKLVESETLLFTRSEELARWKKLEDDQGGGKLEEWRRQVGALEKEKTRRKQNRDSLAAHCAALTAVLPDTGEEHGQLVAMARDESKRLVEEREGAYAAYAKLSGRRDETSREQERIGNEISSLEQSRSHLPGDLLAVRARLAKAVGCEPDDLPFAGELMQVRSEQSVWRPTLEKVLRPLALSLLVDDEFYPTVVRYANANNMGTRLAFQHTAEMPAPPQAVAPNPLCEKLEFKAHRQRAWLERHIQAKFNFHCAENIDDYEKSRHSAFVRALTREGLVRHNLSLNIKDDSEAANNPRKWLLNFDTAERIALLRQDEQNLRRTIDDLSKEIQLLLEVDKIYNTRFAAVAIILESTWENINLAEVFSRIQTLETQITAAESDPELADIVANKNAADDAVKKAEKIKTDIIGKEAVNKRNIEEAEKALAKIENALESLPALPENMAVLLAGLDEWGGDQLPEETEELRLRQRKIESTLRRKIEVAKQEERNLQAFIEDRLKECRREWPEETVCCDCTPDLSGAEGYFIWLEQLESDKLHTHEDRFFQMLHDQGLQHLVSLNTSLLEERKEINRRMRTVNNGLQGKEFNSGTHLRIDTRDRALPQATELRAIIKTVCEGYVGFDVHNPAERSQAETRYGLLDNLVERLKSEAEEWKRWRQLALDVREHVEFVAYEVDADGNTQESYRSGDGKSGGQRQKLTAACLAAALRYQLGGPGHAEPVFTTIVLDEAFANADHDFTRQSMNIFTHFGFQMIVATPFKSVRTLEPYIGAVCVVEILDRRHSREHVISDLDTIRATVEREEGREP